MNIQFIGCGKLGKIFLEFFLENGIQKNDIWATTGSADSLGELVKHYDIQGGKSPHADIVFLGIKPQQLSSVDLSQYGSETLVISPLAGTPVSRIKTPAHICRIMPNILLSQKRGTTLIFAGNAQKNPHQVWFEDILRSGGNVIRCASEDELDHLTTISGCAPAYFFAFAKALEECWIQNGGTPESAHKTIENLFIGSAEYALASGKNFSENIATVASKGGVTQKALDTFAEKGLTDIIHAGLDAAYKRSKELAELQ